MLNYYDNTFLGYKVSHSYNDINYILTILVNNIFKTYCLSDDREKPYQNNRMINIFQNDINGRIQIMKIIQSIQVPPLFLKLEKYISESSN